MQKQTDAFPPPRRTYRSTFSLPVDLARNLAMVAKRMGVSQSALLAVVLEEPMQQLADLVADIPPKPTGEDVKRLRGRSEQLIRDVIEEALRDIGQDGST